MFLIHKKVLRMSFEHLSKLCTEWDDYLLINKEKGEFSIYVIN